jgi:hypothetical protein
MNGTYLEIDSGPALRFEGSLPSGAEVPGL